MGWIDQIINKSKGSCLDIALLVQKLLKLPQCGFKADQGNRRVGYGSAPHGISWYIEPHQTLSFWVVLEYVIQAKDYQAGHLNYLQGICRCFQNCDHSLNSETKIQGFISNFFKPKW